MKTPAAFAAVLFAASQLAAQNPLPAKTAPAKAPVAVKTPAAKVEVKKAEEPKIPGLTLTRANGTFLGLEVVGGNFKLSFYDKKKKIMAPDVTRANARWPNSKGKGDNRTVLNSSGSALVGNTVVQPPYVFTVYLTLLQGEGNDAKAVENYVVPFRK